jgi:Papain family cysteine protease
MPDHGLGRRHAPDPRDANFPLRALLPAAPSIRTYRYWSANGWWGDQGRTPQCVAYAWAHWLEDGPVPQGGTPPILHPAAIYHDAQFMDEWPGEDYDGTSVRAGAKVLKTAGYIKEYRWASTMQEIVAALLDVGPVVVGFSWYEEMFKPDEASLIHIGGALAGGHAFVLDGISMPHKLIRMKNSWGRDWGNNGFAYLSIEDVDHLLHEDGEACLAVEIRK